MNTLLFHALPIVCAVALGTIAVDDAIADRRVALVIGNAKCEHADTLTQYAQ
jgi:hypothetical protein